MRWFVLRDSKLMYYDNDSEEKLKGTIDIRAAKCDFHKASPLFQFSKRQLSLSDLFVSLQGDCG